MNAIEDFKTKEEWLNLINFINLLELALYTRVSGIKASLMGLEETIILMEGTTKALFVKEFLMDSEDSSTLMETTIKEMSNMAGVMAADLIRLTR